ncbi:MAG: hypothetical protein AB4063_19735 [Crocosphaera sp.]
MTTLQIIATVTDFAYYTWFTLTGFLLAACVLSHTVRFYRQCKAACLNRRISEQATFLMSADYGILYRHAKDLGLITQRVKKDRICYAIATYQLG